MALFQVAGIAFNIINAGTNLVNMLEQIKNNNREAHKIQELIELVNGVCSDLCSYGKKNSVQMERDDAMSSAGKRLMEALQEAEQEVRAYLEKNAGRKVLKVDGMTKKLSGLRREIMDRLTVLGVVINIDGNETVREGFRELKSLMQCLVAQQNMSQQAAGRMGTTTSATGEMASSQQPQVWEQEELLGWQQNVRDQVVMALSLPQGLGIPNLLLRHCNWMPRRVEEEWRHNRDKFCRDVGLQWPSGATEPKAMCIKFKRNQFFCDNRCSRADAASERLISAGCSHYYCNVCWRGHISAAVDRRRKGFLSLRCPHKSCGAAVLLPLLFQVADAADRDKIVDYMNRSPVDDSGGRMKWCPAGRKCSRAIEFHGGADARGKDLVVVCNCGFRFCWSCCDRPHRALSCRKARQWVDTIEARRGQDEVQAAKASGAYRRWKDCHASLDKADKEMEGLNSSLRALADQVRVNVAEFEFVTQAYEGIMACQRLIRWVYVYEYYNPDRCQKKISNQRNTADRMIKRLEYNAMGYRAKIANGTHHQEYSTFKRDVIKFTRDARDMVERLVEAAETA